MNPLLLRDSIVRSLTRPGPDGKPPSVYLVDLDALGALLHVTSNGRPLVLISWPAGSAVQQFVLDRIQRIAQGTQPRTGDIALVGGGEEAAALVDSLRIDRRIRLHLIREDGAIEGRTKPPRALARAVREALAEGHPRPLDPSEVSQLRAAFRQVAETEQAFVRALHEKLPVATIGLIAVCAAVFALQLAWGLSTPVEVRMGAVDGQLVRAGEWWRVCSGAFLHGGWVHIGVNMWSLWVLGKFIEPLFGTPRFVVLYVASAVVGGLATAGLHANTLSVGASGAIFGLLGALVALTLGPVKLLPPSIMANLRRTLWPVVLLNVGISLAPGIDALAHLGGALTGLGLALSGLLVRGLPGTDGRGERGRRAWQLAAVLAVGVIVASEAAAFAHGRPWELAQAPKLVRQPVPGTPFTLGLPDQIRPAKVKAQGGVHTVVFGTAGLDPLLVEVQTWPSTGALDARDEAQLARPDPGMRLRVPDGAVKRENLGGVETLTSTESAATGLSLLRTLSYRHGFRVELDVALEPELPAKWAGVDREIVASLQPP